MGIIIAIDVFIVPFMSGFSVSKSWWTDDNCNLRKRLKLLETLNVIQVLFRNYPYRKLYVHLKFQCIINKKNYPPISDWKVLKYSLMNQRIQTSYFVIPMSGDAGQLILERIEREYFHWIRKFMHIDILTFFRDHMDQDMSIIKWFLFRHTPRERLLEEWLNINN